MQYITLPDQIEKVNFGASQSKVLFPYSQFIGQH